MAVFWGFATDIESCLSPYSVVMPCSRPQWLPDGGTVSALSLGLLLAVFAFDAVTPSRLVLGILLTAPVALSGLDGTRQITRLMVPLALLANVVAAWLNAQVDGWRAGASMTWPTGYCRCFRRCWSGC